MPFTNTKKTCLNGHIYYKSSSCPVCPVCEAASKPASGFLSLLSAPVRRALVSHHISSLQQLAAYTEKEILSFHGIGKSIIPILQKALTEQSLSFKSIIHP